MEYSSLKEIVSVQSFNIIHQLINKPQLSIYKTNVINIDNNINDPFDNDNIDIENIIPNDKILIGNYDCIYTYDKTLITNNNKDLGSILTLTVYLRYDDVPSEILNITNTLIVTLNEKEYKITNVMNAYNIIIQFELSL